ncbi:MAG: malonyl CoA-acyl carrier protein transacylase, partial [Desulfobacterales bacterium]
MKKTAVLFPGQGSQYIGMGEPFLNGSNDAEQLFEIGESLSG